jgi:hypothetical protein
VTNDRRNTESHGNHLIVLGTYITVIASRFSDGWRLRRRLTGTS